MKLALGTVQFGLPYGVSNRTGQTPLEEVRSILQIAANAGIRMLDTAPAYGIAESVLGKALWPGQPFHIVSKTLPLGVAQIEKRDIARLTETVHASLKNLRQEAFYGLLVHRAADLLVPGGQALIESLIRMKRQGKVRKIGVSVYDASEIDKLIDHVPLDIVQLPLSIVDQRLLRSGHLAKLKVLGVEIHVRSVFLQGLLLMNTEELPTELRSAAPYVDRLVSWARRLDTTRQSLALAFVRDLEEIDYVVIGVNNVDQLQENLAAYAGPCVPPAVSDSLACFEDHLVNPVQWGLK